MKRLLPVICIFYCYTSSAQEMWGIANSNYAASAGMSLNPSSMLLMPYKWEATIISADISLQNNYVAFARDKASNTAEGTPDPHRGVVDYYTSGNKSGNVHVMLQLPSITFRTPKMAFGFHVAVRNDLSIRGIPSSLAKFSYEGILYSPLYGSNTSIEGIRAGEMTWAEAGFSVGKKVNKNPEKQLFAAATLKCIAAIQGASVKVTDGSLNIVNDSVVRLSNFSGDLYASMPESPNQVLAFPNRGAAVDLGVCYVSNSNLEHFENGQVAPRKKYDYRIGASLIDAGFVSFAGYTTAYHFNSTSLDFGATGNGVDSVMNSNERKESFIMALPTALSVQYDRCLKPKFFFNFSAIQRVPMPMPHIDRPNQLSATVRYETTFFEVAVPYSLYDYNLHRIGLAVRYRVLYLGTDKIGTFINNKEITGVDFYFGIRLTNFDFSSKPKTVKKPCPAYL